MLIPRKDYIKEAFVRALNYQRYTLYIIRCKLSKLFIVDKNGSFDVCKAFDFQSLIRLKQFTIKMKCKVHVDYVEGILINYPMLN